MLLIYSQKVTNRLKYILETVFSGILNVEWELTENISYFNANKNPKINYSPVPLSNSFTIIPHELLFQTTIELQTILVIDFDSLPAFFPTSSEKANLPFDIFAASFYLISRYEEYLPNTPDAMGRYQSVSSVAAKFNFLEKNIVDLWCLKLTEKLKLAFDSFIYKKPAPVFLPTYDIDMPWAYKNKGFWRTSATLFREFLSAQFSDISFRVKVLRNKAADPYFTFQHIHNLHANSKSAPLFFFPTGGFSKFDKNPNIKNKNYRSLINLTALQYPVGIHPSVKSYGKPLQVLSEIQALELAANTKIQKSRQHYIKLQIPYTYELLIMNGITEDYSMGYSDNYGFRASTAFPFYFFNLKTNQKTNLKIIPFFCMDTVFIHNAVFNTEMHMDKLSDIVAQIERVGGTISTVFHNIYFNNQSANLILNWYKALIFKYF